MKALLIGNGAREHAMGEALARDADLYVVAKATNPGLKKLSKHYAVLDFMNPQLVLEKAKEWGVDFVVVGPEAPLGEGLCDTLEEAGIPCASPSKGAAQIELNKFFCRNLMEEYKTRGRLLYRVFENADACDAFIDEYAKPVVIKPLGLTGGKGVKIVADLPGQLRDLKEAKEYARKILKASMSGYNKVIVEELAVGQEFTLQAFVDGKHVVGMPAVQDHKFAFEGDKGPFTGGMGSYSDANHLLPFMRQHDYDDGIKVIEDVVEALAKSGHPYCGVLYGQFMLTAQGPKVIEFNARFGDPEAMNVLPLLETSYPELCMQMIEGRLEKAAFANKATVCKYIVPEGYPDNPVKGERIKLRGEPDANLYFASIDDQDGELFMSSSRALAFVGIADTIAEAERIAQKELSGVSGKVHYRNDIGTQPLIQKRIDHMQALRE